MEIAGYPHYENVYREMEGLLNELGIPFENDGRCIHRTRFDYDEDLNRIASVVQDTVGKIPDAAKYP